MFGKIARFASLFRRYGAGAFRLIINPLLGKPAWFDLHGDRVWLNFDRSTYYHLLHSVDKLEKLVNAIPADVDGVVVDGGANHGIFSMLAARHFPGKKIYAVEAYPKLLPILEKNVAGKNIEIIPQALAAEDGEVSFFTSETSDQMGSTIPENVEEFTAGAPVQEVRVPAVSLANLVRQEGISKIAVLKLDVQGAEFSILKPAAEVLAITEYLVLEVCLIEKTAMELLEHVRKIFPHFKSVNPIIYGADIIFSKKPW
ncbi:MAG: FkbM family methyltransferase [Bacteroidota bacterium]